MTDDLYERYKEALRIGHVAVLRGALGDAVEAYRAAAVIAPSRALPHTSLAGVLLRLGHLEEALMEYAAAVARSPHDEGALLGQAEALTVAGQRVDAALSLDHVSEIQEASGRLPEAADTLRRALELEDAPERTRRQRGLLREIRLSAGDAAAEQLLARALRLRDEPAGNAPEAARSATAAAPIAGPAVESLNTGAAVASETSIHWTESAETPSIAAFAEDSVPAGVPEQAEAAGPVEAASEAATEPVGVALEEPAVEIEWPKEDRAPRAAVRARMAASVPVAEPAPVAAFAEPVEPGLVLEAEPVDATAQQDEPPAVGVMEGAFGTAGMGDDLSEKERRATGDELLASAEAADQAGDDGRLRSLLVWTARAYGREGRFEAGLDAMHRLLQRDPGNVEAHLVLVDLYVARGWNSLAAEKLVLLGRLADLDDDQETRQRLCAVASRAFPDDEHLATLCA
jgi:tetratricopeptide (TPR) repeat protein